MKFNLLILLGMVMFSSLGSAAIIQFTDSTPAGDSVLDSDIIYVKLETDSTEPHFSFLDFDNSLRLWLQMDEDNADKFEDSSQDNHQITTIGEVPISSGKFGNAAVFDRGNYIEIDNTGDFNPENITISAWINPASTHQYAAAMMKSSSFNWDDGYGMAYYDGGINFFINSYADGYISADIETNTWTHVVATYDGETSKLYINGQLVGTRDLAGGISPSSSNILIGRGAVDEESYWDGMIDEVIILDRALGDGEITSLYDSAADTYEHSFSNLAQGEHTLQGYFKAESGESGMTEKRTIIFLNGSIEDNGQNATNHTDNNETGTGDESDTTAPQITVISLIEDSIYYFNETGYLDIIVETNEQSLCDYTLDAGKTNYTMASDSGKTSFNDSYLFEAKNRAFDIYHFIAKCTDNAGNSNLSEDIRFFVNFSSSMSGNNSGNQSSNDTERNISSFISIITPEATIYTANNYLINISLSESGSCFYTFDSGMTNKTLEIPVDINISANTTVNGTSNMTNMSTSFYANENNVPNGEYGLQVYCTREMNSTNSTQNSTVLNSTEMAIVSFTIAVPEPSSTGSGSSSSGGGGYFVESSSSNSLNASELINQSGNLLIDGDSDDLEKDDLNSTENEFVTLEQNIRPEERRGISRITRAVVGVFDSAKQSRFGGLYLVLTIIVLTGIFAATRLIHRRMKK